MQLRILVHALGAVEVVVIVHFIFFDRIFNKVLSEVLEGTVKTGVSINIVPPADMRRSLVTRLRKSPNLLHHLLL